MRIDDDHELVLANVALEHVHREHGILAIEHAIAHDVLIDRDDPDFVTPRTRDANVLSWHR